MLPIFRESHFVVKLHMLQAHGGQEKRRGNQALSVGVSNLGRRLFLVS